MRSVKFTGAVQEQTASVFNGLNNLFLELGRDGGTAFAAAAVASLLDIIFFHVVGGVHDDASFQGLVVDALFNAHQAKGITVLAKIRAPGDIEPEAAHKAAGPVGKFGGDFPAGIAAMGDKGVVQQPSADHINHKQSFLIGRYAEVDNGNNIVVLELPQRLQAGIALDGIVKGLARKIESVQLKIVVEHRVAVVCLTGHIAGHMGSFGSPAATRPRRSRHNKWNTQTRQYQQVPGHMGG